MVKYFSQQNSNLQNKLDDLYKRRLLVSSILRLVVVAAALASTFYEPAFAQSAGGADPTTMINNICNFILGPFGKSLAILGIVAIGLSWMFGRASLGLVAGVVGGIIIMFGASFLGQTLTGG